MVFIDFKENLQVALIQGESFWRISSFARLSRKNGFVFVNQIWHSQALNIYCMVLKIRFRFLRRLKRNLQGTLTLGERFQSISRFAWLSQKNGSVFVNQIWYPKVWSQYPIPAFDTLQNKFIGNSNIKRKFLERSKPHCLRKVVLYSSTTFGILKASTNIKSLR